MAKTTTTIKLTNSCAKNLLVTSAHLDVGTWSPAVPSGSLAPNGTMIWTSESDAGYPKGFVNIAMAEQVYEWVLVWWEGRGARAVAKSGAIRGTHQPALYAQPQDWTRADEGDAFEVAVIDVPNGGRAVLEACVAPFNQNCITVKQITSMQRVMRANEEAVIERFTDPGVDRNAWVVAGQPLRVRAIAAKPSAISWSMRVTTDGKTVDAPVGSWHSNGDKLKMPKVSAQWDTVRVEAKIGNEVRGSVIQVARAGVSKYIALVKKLEVQSSQSAEWVLNCLRGIALYKTPDHDAMMGAPPAPDPSPFLAWNEIDDMTTASAHGKKNGHTVDLFGKDVAIGHVITGLNAGLHRNKAYVPKLPFNVNRSQILPPFDNLWGETLAGDLAQAAVLFQRKREPNLIGPGSGADYSELNADLDGLALGEAAAATLGSAGGKVSALLEKYYLVAPNEPSTPSAAHRMSQRPVTAAEAGAQAKPFGFYFARKDGDFDGTELLGVNDSNVEGAVDAFLKWQSSEASKESADRGQADLGDTLDKSEGFD